MGVTKASLWDISHSPCFSTESLLLLSEGYISINLSSSAVTGFWQPGLPCGGRNGLTKLLVPSCLFGTLTGLGMSLQPGDIMVRD